MSVLAGIRPDDWNLALFVHILGAMALVGALALVLVALAGRDLRLGYRALLLGVLPGWIVMRGGARVDRGEGEGERPRPGAELGRRRLQRVRPDAAPDHHRDRVRRRGGAGGSRRAGALRGTALVMTVIMLVAAFVAVWAMSTKPT